MGQNRKISVSNTTMNLPLRELKEDIDFLRNFSMINSGNEIGQKLNMVLDYAEKQLSQEDSLPIIPPPMPSTLNFNGVEN